MSLRSILVIPFVLQIVVAVGLTGWLSLQNGQKAVNEVATKLRSEVTARIQERLLAYIEIPPLVNQITANAIATGQLDLENDLIRGRHFWKQVVTFPQISVHFFGNTKGEFFTARRLPSGEVQVGLADRSTNGNINYFMASPLGDRLQRLDVIPQFDPRMHPWYKAAVAFDKPGWTKIYRNFVTKGLGISSVQPVYDRAGNLIGVLGTDLMFLQVNEFLQDIKIGQSGQTFIIERDGMLVSTSTQDPVFIINGEQTARIKATESANPLIRVAAQKLDAEILNSSSPDRAIQLTFESEGKRQFAQVTPLRDRLGIDWLIVVVVPEDDFMAQIHANTQMTVLLCFLALIVSVTLGLLTSRSLVQPILQMIDAADALSQGEWQRRVPENRSGSDQLGRLAKAFNRMAAQIQEAFARLQYTADRDDLTGLPNRTAFMKKLQAAFERTEQDPTHLFAVLFLDLDSFKLVNNSLGHFVGDRLLVEVAARIQLCLGSDDTLARFGGDEFTILLRNITNRDRAIQVAEQIAHALKRPFDLDNYEIFVNTSIGVVLSTLGNKSPESYIRDADIAMYHAKARGKDRYELFDQLMHSRTIEQLKLETDLRHALERSEFVVYYQPIVVTATGQIGGFEALVRWQHPTLGFIIPNRFIPTAEETGMVVRLGIWVLREACRQMYVWQSKFPATQAMEISVNLSGRQFFQSDLLEQICQVLAETGLPPYRLKLEITESTIMGDVVKTSSLLHQLRDIGIKLSLDDFGTGYSSLSYLHNFPLNTIKIDRSFIDRLGVNGENREIIEAIVDLAHKLNMNVIAEGVETTQQLEHLRSIGCEQVQGYLFAAPLPVEAIEKILSAEI
ncbi:EAL domain-containing protein [Tumidithrix elongata RA019]|uniref:EAL domain-containing protein n=1 Tax=Tumidithrix elongata BACA0141 TaxID=2716417 RepID=A0AAW9PXH5_9CYAN|nr:EAL domain-containing protein [Tumidithrix elongata RA019]